MSSSDIDSISAITAADVQSQISTRVARKTLDVAKDQGDAAVALLESAKSLSEDIAAHDSGRPGGVDVYA